MFSFVSQDSERIGYHLSLNLRDKSFSCVTVPPVTLPVQTQGSSSLLSQSPSVFVSSSSSSSLNVGDNTLSRKRKQSDVDDVLTFLIFDDLMQDSFETDTLEILLLFNLCHSKRNAAAFLELLKARERREIRNERIRTAFILSMLEPPEKRKKMFYDALQGLETLEMEVENETNSEEEFD